MLNVSALLPGKFQGSKHLFRQQTQLDWFPLPSTLPPSSRDPGLNKSQNPCTGRHVSHVPLGPCVLLKAWYSATLWAFRIAIRINKVQGDTFSLLNLWLSHLRYVCLRSYFLDADWDRCSLITPQYIIFHYLFSGWKNAMKTVKKIENRIFRLV